jgi:hypothetical protein
VIAGSKGQAWATRVDSVGNVQWRHEAHVSERGSGEYAGAAILPDDSVVLCGYQRLPEQGPGRIAGLLTHVDKTGRVINERLIEPNDGKYHGLNHLTACVVLGNEILVFGDTYLRESNAMSGWILVLDATGQVKQEKLMRTIAADLDAQLTQVGQLTGHAEFISTKRAYYLPDGSLVLFGGREYRDNSFTASIAWISSDLNRKNDLTIEPPLASDAMVDAVPTGVTGRFATIRPVWPMVEAGHREVRLGAVLAFVEIN